MALTTNVIDRLIDGFRNDLSRGETPYRRIALAGATSNPACRPEGDTAFSCDVKLFIIRW